MEHLESLPFDILLYLNELRESVDWDEYALSIGLPLGASLVAVSFVCKSIVIYYNSITTKSCNLVFDSGYYEYEHLKKAFLSNKHNDFFSTEFTDATPITKALVQILNLILSLIVAICLLNTYNMITRKRPYHLLYCEKKPKSLSIVRVSLSAASQLTNLLIFAFNWVFRKSDQDKADEDNSDQVWQLNMWDPSTFSLYFFIGLNPVNLFLVHSINYGSSLVVIPLIVAVSVILHFFIHDFRGLIQDKQIIYQEVLNEYNNKFVKPKTSKLSKDVVIDATAGPYNSFVLTDIKPYSFTKLKVFVTHDSSGNEVTEYVGYAHEPRNPRANFEKPVFTDSNHLLDRLRMDNELLYIKNQELRKQLQRIQDPELSMLESESESERDDYYRQAAWKNTSHTPFIPVKFENVRNNQLSGFNRYNGPSSIQRTPSPVKMVGTRPLAPVFMKNRSLSPNRTFLADQNNQSSHDVYRDARE